MLINVRLKFYDTFGYGSEKDTRFRAWIEKHWDTFRSVWPLAIKEKPDSAYDLGEGPCRITYEEAQILANLELQFEVMPLPEAMIVKMKDRGRNWGYGEKPDIASILDGTSVQITIPDFALMYIDEVTYRDDCCTDEVQVLLNDGWRILAVCPPNAQRRPDYILGRKKR